VSAVPAELWLRALQRLSASVAHEIRNPLNGVALNLEVLRGRVTRAQGSVSTLSGFAEAAVSDLGSAIRLCDALLAVARPVREPVELGAVIAPIAVLAGAVARARGGSVDVALPDDLPPALAVRGDGLRAALAMILLESSERGATVRCRVGYEEAAIVVEFVTDQEVVLAGSMASDIEACGIAVCPGATAITLRIPRTGDVAP
jgi:nitrogen fixation/metabolism regulation signal transduction histidine kinase